MKIELPDLEIFDKYNINVNPHDINNKLVPSRRREGARRKLQNYNRNIHDLDSTRKRASFVGIALRTYDYKRGTIASFEPGAYPYRRYAAGERKAPILLAIKVRIPELHKMLPIPFDLEEGEDKVGFLSSCPIIDMYPTFYSNSTNFIIPKPGDLVRVTYSDLENLEDPIYLKLEQRGRDNVVVKNLEKAEDLRETLLLSI